jgi:hypothetical protein
MNLVRRLRRHLSFANVVACLALFAALGGSAYAASQINGNRIVKHSIGANKLKNETITSKQIKKSSLNSSVIDLSTLATVPSAQTAVTATSAGSANSANTANSATTAATAAKATSAGSADHASSAGDADTLEGETAAELTVSCPATTELFGGVCWDEGEQQARGWISAIEECSARGGRLPTISELIAYVLRTGTQVSGENWSGDVADIDVGNKELVLTSDETTRRRIDSTGPISLPYRCVFYRAN